MTGHTYGLVSGDGFDHTTALQSAAATGITATLAVGLALGLATTSADRLRIGQDPARIIHDDLRVGLTCGIVMGVVFGLGVSFTQGATAGIAFGTSVALMLAALGPLTGGRAAGRFATATFLFARSGIFPARPAVFLEWARGTGLLRVTGVAYQYRHESYRRWLVRGGSSASSYAASTASSAE